MIKVIIFDADGVVIQGEYFAYYLERDYGIMREKTKVFFEGVFMDCVVGKKDLRRELLPFLKEWGWKKSLNEFLDCWHRAEHTVDDELIAYIQDLRKKGVLCCLATNQNKVRFSYMLHEMGFINYFDHAYASGLLGHRKPFREFYEKVIDDLGITNKKEVLFWDDRLENVESARIFGIHAELYTTFHDFRSRITKYL